MTLPSSPAAASPEPSDPQRPPDTNRGPLQGGLRTLLVAASVVAVASLAIAGWRGFREACLQCEEEAAEQLKALGVLVVRDPVRNCVASLNFATMRADQTSAAGVLKAAQWLPCLTRLTSLDVSKSAFGDDAIRFAASLTQLTSLALNDTPVSDTGLRQLAKLAKLETLYLANTPITGAGLSLLQGSPRLKVLDLSGTQVSDGLDYLAALRTLEWLILGNLDLHKADLSILAEISTLNRLNLEGSTLDPASLRRLAELRPDVRIFQ